MRMRGRLNNPLLRRVQRHTRVSTLFRIGGAEILPAEPGGGQLPARLVTAFLPLAEAEPAPMTAPTSPPSPQTVLAAAPVQAYSAAPVASPATPARIPQAPPPAVVSPASQPVSSAPSAPVPQADAVKVEEDRNWKRLQTILRKHAEKGESFQGQVEAQPPAAAPQPPSIQQKETLANPAEVPVPAPVQRRASVVEELPAVSEGKAPPASVPPLEKPGSTGAPASLAVPQPAPASAGAPLQPVRSVPAGPTISPEAVPPSALLPQAKAETMAVSPESAAQPPALLQPQQVSPSAKEPGQSAKPLQPESSPSAAEAPTVQLPRASLADQFSGKLGEKPPPQEPVPAQVGLSGQVPLKEQSQTEKASTAEVPPISPAPPESPSAPVLKGEPEQAPSRPAPSPVKASLPGQVQLQRAPEPGVVPGQAAPTPQPASPFVAPAVSPQIGEPPPGFIAPNVIPEEVTSTAPLESIWPVQRLPAAAEQRDDPAETTAPGAAPAVLPHNEQVGQMLQSVAPGLPSESPVELVTPRKPRPAVTIRPPASIPPPEPARGEPPVESIQPPSPIQPQVLPAPMEAAERVPPAAALSQAAPSLPEVKPVPTEIGPLPSDLWGLIGQPVPGEAPPLPEQPASAHPERQSSLQRHVADKTPAQRLAEGSDVEPAKPVPAEAPAGSPQPIPESTGEAEAEAYAETAEFSTEMIEPEVPEDVIQRALVADDLISEIDVPVEEDQPVSASPNVEELAQRVYREIRRRLSVEFERWRRGA